MRRPHWLTRWCCLDPGRHRKRVCSTDFPNPPDTGNCSDWGCGKAPVLLSPQKQASLRFAEYEEMLLRQHRLGAYPLETDRSHLFFDLRLGHLV